MYKCVCFGTIGLQGTLDQNISDFPQVNVHSLSHLHYVQLFNE